MARKRGVLDLDPEPKKKIEEAVGRKNRGRKRKRDSKAAPPQIEWPVNDLEYEIYEVVGRGGNAIVNLAKCIKNNKICAIKRVDLRSKGLTSAIDEINTMSTLLHPYLASFHTSFIYDTELWIVLDYYHFGSLEDIKQRNISYISGLFGEKMIASLMKDVLRGLIYLHHYGVIHCDIKPGNILLREDGSAVLADFGSARNVNDRRPGIVTTPIFRAPELVSATFMTCRADIWSVGMTAVNLSGESIYSMSRSTKHLLELYNDFAKHSELFSWVTTSCIILNPEQRQSAWVQIDHKYFKKPMQKRVIVQIVSAVPERDLTWEREAPPYIYRPNSRRLAYAKCPSIVDIQEGENSSDREWLFDDDRLLTVPAPIPTIRNDDEECQSFGGEKKSDPRFKTDQGTNAEAFEDKEA